MKNLKLVTEEDLSIPLEEVKYLSCDFDNETVYFTSNDKLCGYDLKTLNCKWSYTLPRSEPFSEFEHVTGLEAFQGEGRVCVSLDNGGVVSVDVETSTPELEVILQDCSLKSMCWSHDQEIVLLATEHGKIIALTHMFDVIDEVDLHAEGFGAQKFLNVGWGKKETQFQGKSGKIVKGKEEGQTALVSSIDTNTDVKMVWRGDGQYFACSFLKEGQRLFRVWNRDLELQYTSEVLPGIEGCFAWKPSGSFIATTQRKENVYSLVLFEMNGLKHSEFALPCGANELIVKELQWNCDSTILMMMYQTASADECIKSGIMLWTSSNYHWSLKQKFEFKSLVIAVQWDSEVAGNLHVSLEGGHYRLFTWETCLAASGSATADDDSSYLAVVEGSSVKLTPFTYVNIPPPMCCYRIDLKHQVRNVLFCQAPDRSSHMAVLTYNHKIFLFSHEESDFESCDVTLKPELMGPKKFVSLMQCYTQLELTDKPQTEADRLRHLVWPAHNIMVGVVSTADSRHDFLARFDIASADGKDKCDFALTKTEVDGRIVSLCCSSTSDKEECVVIVLLNTGVVMQYSLEDNTLSPRLDADANRVVLTSAFTDTQVLSLPSRSKLLALSTHGELRCDNEVVTEECTSFAISKEFVLVTTSSHKLLSIPRQWFADSGGNRQLSMADKSSERALERGSTIVTHPAHLTKVVLQLPRGNLEIIHPRSLVVSRIKRLLDASRYGEAFVEMRTHRINLNLIHDHSPEKFLSEVGAFVEQVHAIKADYLNIFLADLRADDFTRTMYKKFYEERNAIDSSAKFELEEAKSKANKVDTVCDALIEHFKLLPTEKILFPLITAHVAKSSSEIKEALIVVQKVGKEDLVNRALRYLTVLVDSNTLFRQSLGTYDLRLALMVAQASNDDPKEYMPFLNELMDLDENTRRYRIDMHLKLFAKALAHLATCPGKFKACLDLIKDKNLYREALDIFREKCPNESRIVSKIYADYLVSTHHYKEAGLLLQRCGLHAEAMDCFMRSSQCWREALNVAYRRSDYQKPELERLAKKLAVRLAEENKFMEAAEVYEFHLSSYEEAISNLVNGSHWDRAVSLIHGHNLLSMIESCLKPKLVDCASSLSDNLLSSLQNLKRYKHRLLLVRENKLKAAEDALLYGSGAGDFDSSDIASDFGTVTTASSSRTGSRYSTMSSQATTSRRRRKQEKKRFSLKPGSRFEEEGLLNALHELYSGAERSCESVASLLTNLTLQGLDSEAKELQKSAKSTIDEFKASVPIIWPISAGEGETGFGQHPLVKMCSSAETLEDVRIFLPPKLNFAKFEMHLHSL